MNKEIFIAVCERIKDQLAEIQYTGEDQGQLDLEEQTGLTFPCCLVDMAYPTCKTINRQLQQIRVQISLKIAFNLPGTANAVAEDQTAGRIDIVQKVHRVLQAWTADGLFSPMQRVKNLPQTKRGLKIYECTYAMEYHEKI